MPEFDDLVTLRIFATDRDPARLVGMGAEYADLITAVAHGQGAPESLRVQCVGVRRACDGCDVQATDIERPAGWVEAPGGFDFCPHCAACPLLRRPDAPTPVAGGHDGARPASHPEAPTPEAEPSGRQPSSPLPNHDLSTRNV